jgi:geranylgeranyl pyrophosphate synthase
VTRHSAVPPPVTAVLDASSRWLPARLRQVEQLLREQAGGYGEALEADAATTLEAGGKRLRPMLVLLSAGEEGGEEAVRAATAIELVHMATLVHDDVLDAAPLRRGRPTVAATSGRERATAAGDLLFSRAFALLAAAGDGRSIELLSAASVALARGELAQRQDAYDTTIAERRYLERCRLKTAALFECACLLGRDEPALGAFGAAIGLAFQLLLAAERDPEIRAADLRSLDAAAAAQLCDRIEATGALTQVRSRALDLVAEGKRKLTGYEAKRRKLFDLVADGVVQRYS